MTDRERRRWPRRCTASWPEACQREYDHYGWGEFRDEGGWEEIGPDEE